jgi:hypothetical protein
MRGASIKLTDFITIFRDSGVRSWFDWDRLQSPRLTVVECFSKSKSVLGKLETVWYIWPDGSLGDWRNQDNRRVSVEEAAQLDRFPNAKSHDYIRRLTAQMQAASLPLMLVLPCYRTRDGKLLILDGNHRAIAAFKSGQDTRLLIFAVTGLDNPLVLPDLLHETDSDSPPEVWATRRAEIEHNFEGARQRG